MLRFLVGAGLAATLSTAALGGLMVFTDRGAWEAAVGPVSIITEDFNGLTPGPIADGALLDTGPLEIKRDGSPNGADGALLIEPGSAFGNIDGTNFLDGETGADPHEIVEVTFDGNSVFAFGADWFSPFSGDGIGLQVGNDLILLNSITGFNTGFVGFVSDTDVFANIQIVGNPAPESFQELWSADNFSYAVPEPTSALLLAAGLAVVSRRRR